MKKELRSKKAIHIGLALLFIAIPLLSAALFCLKDGKTISDVYIPLGGWSDEITYYKQIEGILTYGMPRGYFGYNQSRALYGTLGVWGLIPLIPYCLWGWLFGWNYVSPVYANIFFCVLALAGVYFLLRPGIKQMLFFGLFWIVNPFLNRYLLSGVVEASVTSQLLLVTAMGTYLLSDVWRESHDKNAAISDTVLLVLCTVLICFMALARPYFAVLFLIPLWKACRDKQRVWQVILPVLAVAVLGLFFVNSYFFCSSYFANMISFSKIGEAGIGGAVLQLFSGLLDIARLIWYAVRYSGAGAGWYYLLLAAELFVMASVCIYRRLRRKRMPPMFLITLLSDILILCSIIELYDLSAGARHILALITANALLLTMETRMPVNLVLAALCVAAAIRTGNADTPPWRDNAYALYMEQLKVEFSKVVHVTDQISYHNVVAMPTADSSAEVPDENVCTYYGLMFAMPAGVGISLDYEDYYDRPENIKAGYILVHPDGLIRIKLEEAGMICVYENQELALYAKD